jgi:hypothetical protein
LRKGISVAGLRPVEGVGSCVERFGNAPIEPVVNFDKRIENLAEAFWNRSGVVATLAVP